MAAIKERVRQKQRKQNDMKKLKRITVDFKPNGYILKFDGMQMKGGYMYFSPEKLLKGFMLHIGMEMTEQLNMETIDDFLVAALNWKENKECLKEIKRLNSELRLMTQRRNGLARKLIEERNNYISFHADVTAARSELEDNKLTKKTLDKVLGVHRERLKLTMKALGAKNDEGDALSEHTTDESE